MREILFRGKRVDNGEWAYGYYFFQRESLTDNKIHFITTNNGFGFRWFSVIPETVGQYTGLTDKNGKKIFENDIVRDKYGEIFFIMFSSNGYFVASNYDYWEFINELCEIEVIGNIHDNRELLEEEK